MTPHDSTTTVGADLVARDAAVCWHPYTQHGLEDAPLPVVAARGATLTLADGREVLDAISSWWAVLHGHGEPRIAEAMASQARTLDHVLFAGATHEGAVRLAERLVELSPAGLERVFFSDDGSTAVEVALKIVVQWWQHRGEPERRVFLALEGAYHGDTFGAMSIGDPDPFFLPFAPLCFEAARAEPDLAAITAALDGLGPRAAGVIVEPLVQGAAGMLMQAPEFLRGLRRLCTERGLPLIADEVMTGFGRTGALFACDVAGIAPDLMCLAKGLTGGATPMSVTLARSEHFEAFLSSDRADAFFHGHTFTAHPIGCAAALASLELTLERDVPARLEALGARIHAQLAERLDRARTTGLRQRGGIVAFDLVGEGDGYLAGDPATLRRRAIELGVLLRPLGKVLYAMPPACTTDAEADRIAAALVELAGASA
jgi:adenosylmethionine-8-amino-7-oxononanoate aminotransferase